MHHPCRSPIFPGAPLSLCVCLSLSPKHTAGPSLGGMPTFFGLSFQRAFVRWSVRRLSIGARCMLGHAASPPQTQCVCVRHAPSCHILYYALICHVWRFLSLPFALLNHVSLLNSIPQPVLANRGGKVLQILHVLTGQSTDNRQTI